MKTIVCTKYGPPEVLQFQEVAKPFPRDHEVLVKVHATTVTAGDVRIRGFVVHLLFWIPSRFMLGWKRPKSSVLGVEFAGEVESVGKDVTRFHAGERVYGSPPWLQLGCYAEYLTVPEDGIITQIPAGKTYQEVASVPFMGIGALYFLRKANLQKGQKILIYGASGAVGTYAVQLAKYFGAEVTGVCSTANLEMVKSIGADKVVDYTQEDFSKNGEIYDVVFDTVGKSPFTKCIRSLKKDGVYILADQRFVQTVRGIWTSLTSRKKVITHTAVAKDSDLEFFNELLESGAVRPVIDRVYPFDEMVEAHRYVDKGHKKGNVVINVVS